MTRVEDLDSTEFQNLLQLGWGAVLVSGTGAASMLAEVRADDDGTDRLRVRLLRPRAGGILAISWRIPCVDAAAFWSPGSTRGSWLPMAVGDFRFTASATRYSPVGVLLAHDGSTRLAFAVSETLWPIEVGAGVDDLSLAVDFIVNIRLTVPASRSLPETYDLDVLIDTRRQPLADAAGVLTGWYAADHRCELVPPTEHVQAPVYSTWYSFQQTIGAEAVESQSALARDLGFGTVIVDDGWQTDDTSRDYSSCGDWVPDPAKFPDMAAHVARVQGLGLRYILWIAPPLLGRASAAWRDLSACTLAYNSQWRAAILDPREPAVREHLVRACVRAVEQWNVDGLKIDFIDALAQVPAPPPSPTADCALVAEGADRLLADITARAAVHRPDLMVEFRQEYVSPRLWRYSNLLRAFDCPYDAVENRVRTVRARLLAGPGLTVHSDPIAWHPDATSADAARHLLNAAFSVPQISMRLDSLTIAHRRLVAHWLRLVTAWRHVLLTGHLTASRPELNHPALTARLGDRAVLAVYADVAVAVAEDGHPTPRQILVLNGGTVDRVLLDAHSHLGPYAVAINDCLGQTVYAGHVDLSPRVHPLAVPAGGTADLSRH